MFTDFLLDEKVKIGECPEIVAREIYDEITDSGYLTMKIKDSKKIGGILRKSGQFTGIMKYSRYTKNRATYWRSKKQG